MLERWEAALAALERDPMTLDGQLDWVTKLKLLEAYRERDALAWDDPKLALLDLQYHDVRPERSLYERLVRAGKVERLVEEADVTTAMTEPPPSTRAYFRGQCLARWPDAVVAANWDSLILDVGSDPLAAYPDDGAAAGNAAPTSSRCSRSARPPPSWWLGWRRRRSAMPERERKQTPGAEGTRRRRSRGPRAAKQGEELKEELDDLLDEIDSVLEENAEDFVKTMSRKGVNRPLSASNVRSRLDVAVTPAPYDPRVKRCPKCGESKPLAEFYAERGRDGIDRMQGVHAHVQEVPLIATESPREAGSRRIRERL